MFKASLAYIVSFRAAKDYIVRPCLNLFLKKQRKGKKLRHFEHVHLRLGTMVYLLHLTPTTLISLPCFPPHFTGDGTQGLVHAKQTFYLSYTHSQPSVFICIVLFYRKQGPQQAWKSLCNVVIGTPTHLVFTS